ncbi:hypothetical protein NDU88_005424 [Pleurodeles waltl]|uniref:Uncharacterized protein n=1 Tax=Pleurodeles waltl TaxID=8319 RepID=A0AAV7SLW6_PLEWA|nr:hypothetical protein NDU88_005424 [Pleurodeles waltl]
MLACCAPITKKLAGKVAYMKRSLAQIVPLVKDTAATLQQLQVEAKTLTAHLNNVEGCSEDNSMYIIGVLNCVWSNGSFPLNSDRHQCCTQYSVPIESRGTTNSGRASTPKHSQIVELKKLGPYHTGGRNPQTLDDRGQPSKYRPRVYQLPTQFSSSVKQSYQ